MRRSGKVQNLRSAITWGIAFGSEQTHALLEAHKLNFKKIPFTKSPLEIFSKLHRHYETAYILESIEGPRKLAQYSFIGFDPRLTIKIKNKEAVVHNEKTGEEREKTSDPLYILEKLVKGRALPNKELRFVGGAVGYISYDAVRYWEKLPQKAIDDLNFPDAQLGFFDDGIVFDHRQRRAFYYYSNDNRLAEVERLIKQPSDSEALAYNQPKVNVTKKRFVKAVEKAKEYIVSGDIFQVVLSKRYEFRVKGDLIAFYRSLR
ncbi:MAG TPA: hypothetical protein VMW84_03455, partial [Acidobacteriota bacterium]|nr:hypothetical protein [Acidobacteriota bacterium]